MGVFMWGKQCQKARDLCFRITKTLLSKFSRTWKQHSKLCLCVNRLRARALRDNKWTVHERSSRFDKRKRRCLEIAKLIIQAQTKRESQFPWHAKHYCHSPLVCLPLWSTFLFAETTKHNFKHHTGVLFLCMTCFGPPPSLLKGWFSLGIFG